MGSEVGPFVGSTDGIDVGDADGRIDGDVDGGRDAAGQYSTRAGPNSEKTLQPKLDPSSSTGVTSHRFVYVKIQLFRTSSPSLLGPLN